MKARGRLGKLPTRRWAAGAPAHSKRPAVQEGPPGTAGCLLVRSLANTVCEKSPSAGEGQRARHREQGACQAGAGPLSPGHTVYLRPGTVVPPYPTTHESRSSKACFLMGETVSFLPEPGLSTCGPGHRTDIPWEFLRMRPLTHPGPEGSVALGGAAVQVGRGDTGAAQE